jgi:hypothetical protein
MAALIRWLFGSSIVLLTATVGCDSRTRRSDGGGMPELVAIEAVEAVRIGGPDASGAAAFMSPDRLIADGAGEIFVIDGGTASVSVFGYDGEHTRTLGGRGRGPGEFTGPQLGGFKGDTLWIWDWNPNRTTFFDRSGGVVRTSTDTLSVDPVRYRWPSGPLMYGPDGAILYGTPNALSALPDTATAARVLVTADGRRDTVAFMAIGMNSLTIPELGGGSLVFPEGSSARDAPLLVVQPRGGRFAVVERWNPGDDQSPQLRVRVHGSNGQVLAERDFPEAYRLVTADPVAASEAAIRGATERLEGVFRQLPNVAAKARVSAVDLIRANIRFPARLPAVDRAVMSGDGLLWLRITPGAETHTRWLVLDENARPLGLVTLPVGFRLQDHDRGRAWGFQTDELDVAYVVGMDIAWSRTAN